MCSIEFDKTANCYTIQLSGERLRHYAFLKKKQFDNNDKAVFETYENIDNSIRENFFQSLGINIIWVDCYSEIPVILNNLTE